MIFFKNHMHLWQVYIVYLYIYIYIQFRDLLALALRTPTEMMMILVKRRPDLLADIMIPTIAMHCDRFCEIKKCEVCSLQAKTLLSTDGISTCCSHRSTIHHNGRVLWTDLLGQHYGCLCSVIPDKENNSNTCLHKHFQDGCPGYNREISSAAITIKSKDKLLIFNHVFRGYCIIKI